jgi:hypothetical protein
MVCSYLIKSENSLKLPSIAAASTSTSKVSIPLFPIITNNYTLVRLKHAAIPNTIYNIRDGVNNTLTLIDPTNGSLLIIIPPGSYTVITLVDTLIQLLNAVGSQTYNVSYNPKTFFISFTASNAFALDFTAKSSCARVLGFTKDITPTATVITASKVVELNINSIYIAIDEIPNGIYGSHSYPYTFMIPINENAPSVIQYNSHTSFSQTAPVYRLPLYSLTIHLYQDNNELVDLHGANWEILLEFE